MPGSTPVFGIPYPFAGENITCTDFQAFVAAVDTALAANISDSDDALDRPILLLNHLAAGATYAVNVESNIDWQLIGGGIDNSGMFTTATPTQFTVQVAGVYLVVLDAAPIIGFTTVTSTRAAIYQDAALRYAERKNEFTGATVSASTQTSGLLACNAGSVIQGRALINGTGGPGTMFGGNFYARYVCPL